MKRVISTLDYADPNNFKDNSYLLIRTGDSNSPYDIKRSSQEGIDHRKEAKKNNNYIEMNNYAEDYVWDQKYPDIPESYDYPNVATNTGLVLIFYDDYTLIIYDLLVDNTDDPNNKYKVKLTTYPQDRVETRRYSVVNGKFVMNALFKDEYGYYGVIDSMKTINIDAPYNNNAFMAEHNDLKFLKDEKMNQEVINQGFTFSTERTFDYIILPSKKYFRTSADVTIYGPNTDSIVCLEENGTVSTNTEGTFWHIKEPFYTTDGIGFIILKCAGNNSCILEVS